MRNKKLYIEKKFHFLVKHFNKSQNKKRQYFLKIYFHVDLNIKRKFQDHRSILENKCTINIYGKKSIINLKKRAKEIMNEIIKNIY